MSDKEEEIEEEIEEARLKLFNLDIRLKEKEIEWQNGVNYTRAQENIYNKNHMMISCLASAFIQAGVDNPEIICNKTFELLDLINKRLPGPWGNNNGN